MLRELQGQVAQAASTQNSLLASLEQEEGKARKLQEEQDQQQKEVQQQQDERQKEAQRQKEESKKVEAGAQEQVVQLTAKNEEEQRYLRHIVMKYLLAGTDKQSQLALLPVLGQLLQFSAAEIEQVQHAVKKKPGMFG